MILTALVALLISHMIRDIVERSTYRKVDQREFPRSLFFTDKDKKEYLLAYRLSSLLEETLSDDKMDNSQRILVIENALRGIGDIAIDSYMRMLLLGQVPVPFDTEFEWTEKEKEILKNREMINTVICYMTNKEEFSDKKD